MDREQLKEWILSNLFDKSGKSITARFSFGSNSWMIKNHPTKIEEIIELTKFLKEESMSARIYSILNNISEYPKCKRCGQNTKWHQIHRRFMIYCSKTCSNRNNIKTGEKSLFSSPVVRNRIKETLLKKYGEDNFFKTEKFREDFKEKFNRRSGSQFNITEEAYKLLNNSEELKRLHHEEKLSHAEIAIKYDLASTTVNKAFQKHGIEVLSHPNSIGQKEVFKYVKEELGQEALENDHTALTKLELDIWIPEKKVAIEYHGAHYHSSRFMRAGQHKYKFVACQHHGIRLLQFFDIEWRDRSEIIKSIIKAVVGDKNNPEKAIHARKCSIKLIEKKIAFFFFEENHLQGAKGINITYGLFFEEELVSAMSFGKSRFNKDAEYEILRYATIKNRRVVGGASKIFSRFVKDFDPKNVVTYADLRYSNGLVYEKMGFSFSHNTPINYYYLVKGRLENRMNWKRENLKSKLPNFDDNLSEQENMKAHGYFRVFDCGHACFIWNKMN